MNLKRMFQRKICALLGVDVRFFGLMMGLSIQKNERILEV
jgi:hypothetical protein